MNEERYGETRDYKALNEKIEAWGSISGKIWDRLRELYPADPDIWFDGVDPRVAEIREYLDRHPEIISFLVLDDRNLAKGLDGHFIQTNNHISEEDVKKGIEILDKDDGPFLLDDTLHTPELEEWRKKYIK